MTVQLIFFNSEQGFNVVSTVLLFLTLIQEW